MDRVPFRAPARHPNRPRLHRPDPPPAVWLATCGAELIEEGPDLVALLDAACKARDGQDDLVVWKLAAGACTAFALVSLAPDGRSVVRTL